MAKVTLNHIVKKYPGASEDTVKDFHLDINDKEFVVLVGASGCGKSTTLRMIAGLEEISSGELYIGDKVVNNVAPKDRDIAMVFQSYALYPHMTIYQNMAFGLKLRKFNKEEIKKRVYNAAEILNIEHLLERKPKALSGGQRQRVALGRAIVREPQVFLLDEPLSNLDAKLRVHMRAEINKLQKRLGVTMIYVTHDQTEAMTMGDRIVVMDKGRIQQADTPEKIYNQPVNMFVAGFIGSPSMNFIDGQLVENNSKLHFVGKNIDVMLPDAKAKILRDKAYVEKSVILGIRPEDINAPSESTEEFSSSVVATTVEVVENLGHELYLYLTGVGEETLVARVQGRTAYNEGDQAQFNFDMNQIHLFDKSTSRNIFVD